MSTFLEAITLALQEEMTRDARVVLIGEDIGRYGGAFKVTEGLIQQFGAHRVIDTPIAEAAVVGAAIGMAMNGLLPVAELQFIDFISCGGFDELVSVAAKSRYRTGVGVPMVLRGPAGGGVHSGPFHSACPEMWAVTTPGIKVVFPSTPYDAKGLLKAAIRDPDPVLFLEHKFLYRRLKEDLPHDDYIVPLGQGIERIPGSAAAIITYGAMTQLSVEAATGRNVRVIDLRTLVPLDEKIVVDAARETGRVLIVHEHPRRGGLAGEIAAVINEQAFDYLDAPIMRIAPPNTPVPYAPSLEEAYLPNVRVISQALTQLLSY
jgi:2-oxoisovalerate dehydrogenase E1 component beta subunit